MPSCNMCCCYIHYLEPKETYVENFGRLPFIMLVHVVQYFWLLSDSKNRSQRQPHKLHFQKEYQHPYLSMYRFSIKWACAYLKAADVWSIYSIQVSKSSQHILIVTMNKKQSMNREGRPFIYLPVLLPSIIDINYCRRMGQKERLVDTLEECL